MPLKIIERCEACGKEKAETYFTNYKYCIDCLKLFSKGRRKEAKRWAVDYKGGKCQICNYTSDFLGVFDFHHLDPTEKEFTFSHLASRPKEDVQKELDKCILLCCRCHREVHAAIFEERKGEYTPAEKRNQNSLGIKSCKYCNTEFKALRRGSKERVYCSLECSLNDKKPVNKRDDFPSKEELQELIDTLPWTTIGKMYGVTDNAVRKWAKKYEIARTPGVKIKQKERESFLLLKEDGTKICSHCHRTMFAKDFQKNASTHDKLRSVCRGCEAEQKKLVYSQKASKK